MGSQLRSNASNTDHAERRTGIDAQVIDYVAARAISGALAGSFLRIESFRFGRMHLFQKRHLTQQKQAVCYGRLLWLHISSGSGPRKKVVFGLKWGILQKSLKLTAKVEGNSLRGTGTGYKDCSQCH